MTLVDDDICRGQFGEKPTEQRPCNQGDTCSQWFLGPWTPVGCLIDKSNSYTTIFFTLLVLKALWRRISNTESYLLSKRKRWKNHGIER